MFLLGSTTRVTTQFAVGCIIGMTYRASENSGNGAWRVDAYYDTNSNNYDRNLVTYCRASKAIKANVLCVNTGDGYEQLDAGVSFDLNMPILFCNAAQTAGKTNGNNWYSNLTGIDIRNTVAGFASQRGKPLFLVGSVSGSIFTVAQTNFLSYTPIKPCIPLGWFNANADNSFCFLPGDLINDNPSYVTFVDWDDEDDEQEQEN